MPKHILIVDDDPLVITLARNKLRQAGFEVESASNGEVALHMVKRHPFDAIVTDIVMPRMDGVDLYKALKDDPATFNIPVIILTENARYKDLFRRLGVDSFLEKPLNAKALLDIIRTILKDREGLEKILIVGADSAVSAEMARVLEQAGEKTAVSRGGAEAMAMALTMVPKLILLDLLLKDAAPRELIRAWHCFVSLKNTRIVTYTSFSPEEMSNVDAVEQLKQARDECQQAGATRYAGRFSPATFLQDIKPLL
jgi:CheY-like chemotaxis protein